MYTVIFLNLKYTEQFEKLVITEKLGSGTESVKTRSVSWMTDCIFVYR